MKNAISIVLLRWLCLIVITSLIPVGSAGRAPTLLPCGERPMVLLSPWVDTRLWCIEQVIDDSDGGELAFTALAVGTDGILYAARPLTGQVFALDDTNGDWLPDTPRVVAAGLTFPNGLAFFDDALYISGGAHLYRLRDGQLEVLVDDLPAGGGFWTGGVVVGPDSRIYVTTGAPCDFCEPARGRGVVFSFGLDGRDRQQIASGLRYPADIAFLMDALWTVDTASDDHPDLDELNRVLPGAHFGWPYCAGNANQPAAFGGVFDCEKTTVPALTFPMHSSPLGMAAYTGEALPALTNTLLVVLNGSYNRLDLAGYALVAVHFDEARQPVGYQNIIPNGGQHFGARSTEELNYLGYGFWPHRPIDVAVSPEGWVYVSVGGGRILALRPL